MIVSKAIRLFRGYAHELEENPSTALLEEMMVALDNWWGIVDGRLDGDPPGRLKKNEESNGMWASSPASRMSQMSKIQKEQENEDHFQES